LLDITNPAEPVSLLPRVRSDSGNYTLEGKIPSFVLGTPSKILLYICIPEARFVGVIVTW